MCYMLVSKYIGDDVSEGMEAGTGGCWGTSCTKQEELQSDDTYEHEKHGFIQSYVKVKFAHLD